MAEFNSSSSEGKVRMVRDYSDSSTESSQDDREMIADIITIGFASILKLPMTTSDCTKTINEVPIDFRASYEKFKSIEMHKNREKEEKARAEASAKRYDDKNKERKKLLTGRASRSRKRKNMPREPCENPKEKFAKKEDDEAGGSCTSQKEKSHGADETF